jgi:hypothetical protein
MSSVIAAIAWDPIEKQPYGLMGSDSQVSIEGEDGEHIRNEYDARKISISKDKSRLIGHAGIYLNSKKEHYSEKIKTQLNMLNGLINPTKKDLERIAKKINESLLKEYEYSTNLLFMDYSNGNINFHEYLEKFRPNIVTRAIGSGEEYMIERFPELISKYVKNKTIICPMKELVQIFIRTLNYAKKDEYTGGNMSLGIKTPAHTLLETNFTELDENANEKNAKDMYLESTQKLVANLSKKYPSLKEKSLENLIFG